MTLDLFASGESDNEALARRVAAAQADSGFANTASPGDEWSVSRVNSAARELIEGVFPPLWVVGEITNFTRARSGHCYFSLRDDGSQIRCMMWRDEARRLPTTPVEGMKVRALGRLTLYEARGEFQLIVSELEGRGEGLWKLALERLRVKLDAEGLTSPERKRRLPAHPACIGVVTSASGAVLHDIVDVVKRRAPWTRIILCSCRVQGEGAADDIARAIELFGRAGCADVLIVGRGGGSMEDLWAFNEEIVARAIAASNIPTISAVGHETDVTIADLVADLRAPTPSAAAEAAVPEMAAIARELGHHADRLRSGALRRVDSSRKRLFDAGDRLSSGARRGLQRSGERVAAASGRLDLLSPLSTLRRGFAVPLGANGQVLRQARDFEPGGEFTLRVVDGSVPCVVLTAGNDEGL
ncbi:MAG TPA: exodeoxyribonuclease VII large subunit [Longimicrobiaceae bacterium]|nr:exodeoxyribonuclease VII large subunit [Longimicrobiaceae bacterium]